MSKEPKREVIVPDFFDTSPHGDAYATYKKAVGTYREQYYAISEAQTKSQDPIRKRRNSPPPIIPDWRSQKLSDYQIASSPDEESYTIDECLHIYEELMEKDLGEIFIGGAVSLFLQGIIKRSTFKDLDLVSRAQLTLDDDIVDFNGGSRPYKKLRAEDKTNVKCVLFEEVVVDLFVDDQINVVECFYNDKKYICQYYKDILQIKLDWALREFKDAEEILGSHMTLNIL